MQRVVVIRPLLSPKVGANACSGNRFHPENYADWPANDAGWGSIPN